MTSQLLITTNPDEAIPTTTQLLSMRGNEDLEGSKQVTFRSLFLFSDDLQPTMPGRAVPMQQGNNRGGMLELEGPREPREQRDFREYEAPQRNVQPVENRGLGLRGDGNFRNKNVNNAMPRAG
jgi:hypothetical protein